MRKLLLLALTAIYKKIKGKTLFNGNTYYWGKGHIVLLALAIMMVGCVSEQEQDEYLKHKARFGDFEVIVVDSCEYIYRYVGNTGMAAHKGNCKYCQERRKQEMRELIKELKEGVTE